MLLPRLKSLGLLSEAAEDDTDAAPDSVHTLRVACDRGLLQGGLSVALDLTPDELLGPLAHAAGASLRILDVRGRALIVQVGREEVSWESGSLEELVELFNEQFHDQPAVKAVALLGEWEEMLQLWCVEKKLLSRLAREPWFRPQNRLPRIGR